MTTVWTVNDRYDTFATFNSYDLAVESLLLTIEGREYANVGNHWRIKYSNSKYKHSLYIDKVEVNDAVCTIKNLLKEDDN